MSRVVWAGAEACDETMVNWKSCSRPAQGSSLKGTEPSDEPSCRFCFRSRGFWQRFERSTDRVPKCNASKRALVAGDPRCCSGLPGFATAAWQAAEPRRGALGYETQHSTCLGPVIGPQIAHGQWTILPPAPCEKVAAKVGPDREGTGCSGYAAALPPGVAFRVSWGTAQSLLLYAPGLGLRLSRDLY